MIQPRLRRANNQRNPAKSSFHSASRRRPKWHGSGNRRRAAARFATMGEPWKSRVRPRDMAERLTSRLWRVSSVARTGPGSVFPWPIRHVIPPRFRALALFGRRPRQRVHSPVMPPIKNLHNSGSRSVECSGDAYEHVFEAGRPRSSALQARSEHSVWPDLFAMHAAFHN
jgi:hypothetical protein